MMYDWTDEFEHKNSSMLSFDQLVNAIEELDAKGIVSFEAFKNLPKHEIKKRYFTMPHPTTVRKAIIKIEDKRNGKTGLSEYTTITTKKEDGNVKEIKIKRKFF